MRYYRYLLFLVIAMASNAYALQPAYNVYVVLLNGKMTPAIIEPQGYKQGARPAKGADVRFPRKY